MLALLVVALVVNADAPPRKLASPGLNYVNLDAATGDLYADHFAQQLALHGFAVTTRSEIAAVLGFERQKQLLSCTEANSSCAAELAGALGVDGLIIGNLGKFGSGFVVDLKIIDARKGGALGVYSGRPATGDELLDWLDATAVEFAKKCGLTPVVATTVARRVEPSAGLRSKAWVPAVIGGALLITSGVLFGLTKSLEQQLTIGDPSLLAGGLNVGDVVERGQTLQLSSAIVGAVGVVSCAVAVGFLLAGDAPPPVSAGLSVGPHGVSVVLQGRLP